MKHTLINYSMLILTTIPFLGFGQTATLPNHPTGFVEKLSFHEIQTKFQRIENMPSTISMFDKAEISLRKTYQTHDLFLMTGGNLIQFITYDSLENPEAIKTRVIDSDFVSSYDINNFLVGQTPMDSIENGAPIIIPSILSKFPKVDSAYISFITSKYNASYTELSDSVHKFHNSVFELLINEKELSKIETKLSNGEPESCTILKFERLDSDHDIIVKKIIRRTQYLLNDAKAQEYIITEKSQVNFKIDTLIPRSSISKNKQFDYSITPNPTNGYVTINISKGVSVLPISISILNVTGREVKKFTIMSGSTSILNLVDLEQGIYFIVSQSEHMPFSEKIIKH